MKTLIEFLYICLASFGIGILIGLSEFAQNNPVLAHIGAFIIGGFIGIAIHLIFNS